jgi:hypothetical protein
MALEVVAAGQLLCACLEGCLVSRRLNTLRFLLLF